MHEVICPKIPELEPRPLCFPWLCLFLALPFTSPVKAVTAAGVQMGLRLIEGGIPGFGSPRR